jgi:hypothetical protein
MNRRVPVFATWLLHRFGVQRQNEALVGDLAEEYQAGKSRMWYWWQTLVAIFITVIRDVREHKLLALRAVAVAWAVWYAFALAERYIILGGFDRVHWIGSSHAVFQWGWISQRLIQWMLIGWLVARTHRAQAGSMVLMVAAWRLLYCLLMVNEYVAIGTARFSIQTYLQLLTIVPLQLLMLIAGGLLATKGKPEPPMTITLRAT